MVENISLKISKNKLIIALIISAFVGVAISYSDFYLFHFVLLILSIIWIYQIKENEFRLNIDLFTKNHVFTLIIILSWYLTSLFWTPSLELGLKYIFYIYCGLVIILSMISFSSNIFNLDKIFYMLSIFIFIEIIIGLIESFTSFRMPISSYSSIP